VLAGALLVVPLAPTLHAAPNERIHTEFALASGYADLTHSNLLFDIGVRLLPTRSLFVALNFSNWLVKATIDAAQASGLGSLPLTFRHAFDRTSIAASSRSMTRHSYL
jgi:hypothetical protein